MAGGPECRTAAFYLHVPFCGQLCFYCACHTTAMRRQDTLEGYAARSCASSSGIAAAPGLIVESVQWGGGTPSSSAPRGC